MFRDYYACRAWLEGFIPLVYGKEELGLERIRNLLELLGNPQDKFKSVHVAGTSGKGSTAFYIAKLLQITGPAIYSARGPVNRFLPVDARSDLESNRKLKDDYELRVAGNPSTVATPREKVSIVNGQLSNVKVGLHISPHLVDIRERMQVFQLPITNSKLQITQYFDPVSKNLNETGSSLMPMPRFLRLFKQVRPVVEKIQKEKPELTPSYFEILAAATFKYFAEEKVDWAVVEVGLGGRLDATNVLMPEVSVITNIGLDHTDILGDTIEKIAFEKAGIIKPGVPVVTGATGEAFEVIEEAARGKGAKVVLVSGSKYLVTGRGKKQKNAQDLNLELAKKAVEAVLGYASSETRSKKKSSRYARTIDLILKGLPGRFEEIEPNVILDGAHNPDKIRSLLEFVRNYKLPFDKTQGKQITNYKNGNILRANARSSHSVRTIRGLVVLADTRTITDIVLVLAFKKGKDWKTMIDLLLKQFSITNYKLQIIATEFQAVTDMGKFAAVPAEEIAKYIITNYKLPNSKVEVIRNSQEAVFNALNTYVIASTSMSLRAERSNLSVNSAKQSKKEIAADSSNPRNDRSLVIVTGSLYLVGEARTIWYLPEFD